MPLEKPVLSIQMLEDRYALENHLLDAVHHGDAKLATQALQSFRGEPAPVSSLHDHAGHTGGRYSGCPHFTRLFKRTMGETPSQYARKKTIES